jgi:hypothetical protein
MTARHALSFAAVMLLPLQAAAAETLWTEVTVRVYDTTDATSNTRRSRSRRRSYRRRRSS